MSERSIAEIIGWRYCSRGRHWIPPDLDGEDHASRSVTPDDMLGWLHDPTNERHGWSVLGIQPPGEDWAVFVSPRPHEDYDKHQAPTLHAALEAAVRAVAAEVTP